MRISKIQLTNFRRFTDLTIENIPEASKLVLLIGANGSGKSSVFDAFACIQNIQKEDVVIHDKSFAEYYSKNEKNGFHLELDFWDTKDKILVDKQVFRDAKPNNTGAITFGSDGARMLSKLRNTQDYVNLFYGRSSFRQIPRLTRIGIGQGGLVDFKQDSDRPHYFIDRDNRFENDIEEIIKTILEDVFESENKSTQDIKKKYIDPINDSFENIFGKKNGTLLKLIKIIPPSDGQVAQITFQKGESEFHYNYLSAGEKEVFNLLLNLLARRDFYQDSIYYLDEIDLHLNTKIQFNLLKEITENWIPENCQLWTASHSLGFIEYAQQSEIASIIDFDNWDFDFPKILNPEPQENFDIYEIAVPKEFLSSLFQDKKLYFVENKDSKLYSLTEIPETIFIPANNRNNVYHKVKNGDYWGIVDRDFLSDDDIQQVRTHYPNLYITQYYCLENYLYHPDSLEEYYDKNNLTFDKSDYITQIINEKNKVKGRLNQDISLKRTEYPYFSEPEYNGKNLQNRFKNKSENGDEAYKIQEYVNNDDFEVFYKSFSMKAYATSIPQRQNISKVELAKTNWFREKIMELLNS